MVGTIKILGTAYLLWTANVCTVQVYSLLRWDPEQDSRKSKKNRIEEFKEKLDEKKKRVIYKRQASEDLVQSARLWERTCRDKEKNSQMPQTFLKNNLNLRFLVRKALWNIHLPAPNYVSFPNMVHRADLCFYHKTNVDAKLSNMLFLSSMWPTASEADPLTSRKWPKRSA